MKISWWLMLIVAVATSWAAQTDSYSALKLADDIGCMATLLELIEEAERTGRLSDQARKMREWADRLDVTHGNPDAIRREIVENIYEMRALLGSAR